MFSIVRQAALVAGVCLVVSSLPATAAIFKPAPDPINSSSPPGLFDWTATAGFTVSAYSNDSNTDIGSQDAANVELKLESAAWLNTALTFVGGGACGGSGVSCNADTKSGSTTNTGTVFGIHFGNKFLALLYPSAISNFSISGLPNGVSNIYTFNGGPNPAPDPTPLPGAVWLLGSVLAGFVGFKKWRSRRDSVPQPA